jgi:hypothetical protein
MEVSVSEAKAGDKGGRPAKSLVDEIAAAEARLKALRDRQKETDRRYRERNQRAILALIRDETLDLIPIARWRAVMPALRDLLEAKPAAKRKPAQPAMAAQAQGEVEVVAA